MKWTAAVLLAALCARAPEKRAPVAAPVALSPAEQKYRAATELLDREDGSPDEAQALLQGALEADPTFALAYVALARCEERRAWLGGLSYSPDGLAKALKDVDKAFELAPELLDAHIERADVCRHQGDLHCTKEEATRIEALVPDSYEASLVEAWLAEADGRDRDAITQAQRALDRTQDTHQRAVATDLLARSAEKVQDDALTLGAYKQLLALTPESLSARTAYCRVLSAQQKWQDAIDACTAALSLRDTPEARDNLGQACLQLGLSFLGRVDARTVPALECANQYLPEQPNAELALSRALVEQALKDGTPALLDRAGTLIEAAVSHGASKTASRQALDVLGKARARLKQSK